MVIIYLTLAWFLGVWLAWTVAIDGWVWLAGGLAALIAAIVPGAGRLSRQPLRLGLACLGMIGLGGARYTASLPTIGEDHIALPSITTQPMSRSPAG